MPSHTAAYAAPTVAILCEGAGTTLLQKSEQFAKLVLTLALRAMPLGVSYAIWIGVGVVLTAIICATVFKQSLDLPAMAGIAMIVGGVVFIQTSSTAAGH